MYPGAPSKRGNVNRFIVVSSYRTVFGRRCVSRYQTIPNRTPKKEEDSWISSNYFTVFMFSVLAAWSQCLCIEA